MTAAVQGKAVLDVAAIRRHFAFPARVRPVRQRSDLAAVLGRDLGTAHPDVALPAGFAGQCGTFELIVLAPPARSSC